MSWTLDTQHPTVGAAMDDLLVQAASVVYVGWRAPQEGDALSHLLEWAQAPDRDLLVIDVFAPNIDALVVWGSAQDVPFDVAKMDVRDLTGMDPAPDLVIWQHGPEHLSKGECLTLLERLQDCVRIGLVLEVPFGAYPQGELDGNPAEAHLSSWTAQDFVALGMTVFAHESNLVALWRHP